MARIARPAAARFAVAFSLLGIASNASSAQAGALIPDSLIVSRVDEYLGRMAETGYSGGVLVVHDGRTLIAKSYGFANRTAGIRADRNTVYNIGSITKQFTAAAVLRLEELGKLKTTDSISRFFPQAPADKRNITLHQLLTHTAGFESDFSPTDYEPTTRDEYIGRMLRSKLRTPPGTAFSYANSGYSMLAAIIEIVTATEYEQALTELVLRPAGMTQTGYTAPHWAAERIAHGYQNGSDWGTIVERVTGPGKPYWELRGNGGLGTTLDDFARWDAALRSNRVLTDSSRKKFMTGYVNEGPEGRSKYAYGWAVMTTPRNTRLVMHNGGNGIYVAEWLRYVDEGVSIFLASTNSEMKATPVVQVLSRIVFGMPYDLPPRAVAADPAATNALVGTWRLPSGGRLVFTASETGLAVEALGQDAWSLTHAGDTTSAPRAAALNAKTAEMAAALAKGDTKLLIANLADGPPPEQVNSQEAQLMESRHQRWGELKSADVLGTAPGGGPILNTTVRFTFERGSGTNIYSWGPDDKIGDLRAQPYQPMSMVALANNEFALTGTAGSTLMTLRREGSAAVVTLANGSPLRLVR